MYNPIGIIPRYEISPDVDEGMTMNNAWLKVNKILAKLKSVSLCPNLSANAPTQGPKKTAKNRMLFVILAEFVWENPYLFTKKLLDIPYSMLPSPLWIWKNLGLWKFCLTKNFI